MSHAGPDLNAMVVFAAVADTGSFTAAARHLAMPKSTVSRKVGELEKRVGARLIQRTTRRLSLTDVGRVYSEHCARISREADECQTAARRERHRRPVGLPHRAWPPERLLRPPAPPTMRAVVMGRSRACSGRATSVVRRAQPQPGSITQPRSNIEGSGHTIRRASAVPPPGNGPRISRPASTPPRAA